VTGTVNVPVVPLVRLVLDMRDIDCDPSFPLFGCLVNGTIVNELRPALIGESLGDRCGQRRLAVVNVPNSSDVQMR